MAVGLPMKTTYANGDVFSASDVNDITGTVNLVGQTNNFYAGKNKIINGNFGVWQRGTSFSNPANGAYTADRFLVAWDGITATRTISQQTFTPGTAPVSGYESAYYLRWAQSVAGTGTLNQLIQKIEDVRTFAGQTVTLSFWAKAATGRNVSAYLGQNFGTGGSSFVSAGSGTFALTTSWQRFTATITMPSISGKTVGTNSYIEFLIDLGVTTFTIDIWGIQVESGSTATAFQTASGTIQGELALCQRYYNRIVATSSAYAKMGTGLAASTTVAQIPIIFPVEMRVIPTAVDYSTLGLYDGGLTAVSAVALDGQNARVGGVSCTATGLTTYRPYILISNASTNGYLGFSAEL